MRLFKRSCVGLSDKELFDQIKLDKAEDFKRKTAAEYEYVAREHGYDYVPPSQYVPSHSIESSIAEFETVARRQEPGSDISDSIDEENFLRNLSRRQQQQFQQQQRMRKRSASPPLERISEYSHPGREMAQRDYHHRQRRESLDQRYQNAYNEDIYNRRRDGVAHKSSRTQNEARDSAPAERYSEYRDVQAMLSDDTDDDDVDAGLSPGIRRVPTAFSFLSDDSGEQYLAERKNSRYEMSQDEFEYNRGGGKKGTIRGRGEQRRPPSNYAGWGESQASFNERWGKRREGDDTNGLVEQTRRMGLNEYESHHSGGVPSRSRSRLDANADVDEGRRRTRHHFDEYEDRRERNGNFDRPRGRSRSPHGVEGRRSSSRERQFGGYPQPTRDSPPNEIYSNEVALTSRPERGSFYNNSDRLRGQKVGKKKSRGFLGMIRDSVRGKKHKNGGKKAHHSSPSASPAARGVLSSDIFEKRPPSMRSDVSYEYEDRIPYQYGAHERRDYEVAVVADTVDDSLEINLREQYWPQEQPTTPRRSRSRSPAHVTRVVRSRSPVAGIRTRSRSPANGVQRSRSNNSGVPFETTRASAPPLRFNPDHRQRPVPLADSMIKHHYTSAHGPSGGNGWARKPKSPANGRFLDTPGYACYHL